MFHLRRLLGRASRFRSSPPRGPIAKVADIPVGGGKVVSAGGQSLLIVQPTAGQIKAFSANCTHQGTVIADPVNGVSTCPNHGSRFKAADGSVSTAPPALR